jgi:chromate transporter
MNFNMHAANWAALLLHFVSLSLLSVGTPMSAVPEMYRYLVTQQHWLSGLQFSSSIALAQAMPGPNVLFVVLLGWNLGLNAAGGVNAGWPALASALLGLTISLSGFLLPALTVSYFGSGWIARNNTRLLVRAFKSGMAPLVIATLCATGWLLIAGVGDPARGWRHGALAAVSALLIWRTRIHLLWLIALGALLGACGWI